MVGSSFFFSIAGAFIGFFCACAWANRYGVRTGLAAGLIGMVVGAVAAVFYDGLSSSIWLKIRKRWPKVARVIGIIESVLLLALGFVAVRCAAICFRLWWFR